MRVMVKFGASATTESSAAGHFSYEPDIEGGGSSGCVSDPKCPLKNLAPGQA